jgi:hypothetical protein
LRLCGERVHYKGTKVFTKTQGEEGKFACCVG